MSLKRVVFWEESEQPDRKDGHGEIVQDGREWPEGQEVPAEDYTEQK